MLHKGIQIKGNSQKKIKKNNDQNLYDKEMKKISFPQVKYTL